MPKLVQNAKPISQVDRELVNRIQLKLEECGRKLNYEYDMPSVSFDLAGKTAGLAYYQRNHIKLNKELLLKNTEEMVENTLPHEFAHIASYKFYGSEGTGHGFYWKRTMIRLGLEPKRCHQMEVTPARKHQKFDYVCGCPGQIHKIGKNVHHKIQNEGSKRYCRRCRVYIREA